MAEYLANATQLVELNQPVNFSASIPCSQGNVVHEDETGIFILRGATPNCFARYQVTYNGNNNVTSTAIVTVPRGCCFSIGVRAVSGLVDDAAGTPAPSINVTNSNLVITRIA